MKINTKQRETISSIIGETIHTALRKYCDSPESTDAWRAIRDLPAEDWSVAVDAAADEVVVYIESGEDSDKESWRAGAARRISAGSGQFACGAINPVSRTVCVMPPHGAEIAHIGRGETWR